MTSMVTGLPTVQQALYDCLSTDGPLADAGFKVFYDEATPNYPGKHIVIGDSTEQRKNTFAQRGFEGTETMHVWVPGASGIEARVGIQLIGEALEANPPAALASCRSEFATVLTEPGWKHGVVRYRTWARAAVSVIDVNGSALFEDGNGWLFEDGTAMEWEEAGSGAGALFEDGTGWLFEDGDTMEWEEAA